MARADRLLELLITLRTKPRFSVRELADTLGVSRRTMLRDLHALSAIGVPLLATPGPGGGYALARDQRLPPLALTVEEALGMLLSYESFLRYAQSPFAAESLSAATKLRGLLPADVLGELERLRRHVAVLERPRDYTAPLLGELLRAAVDGAHLHVVYDALSGRSERSIFPYGLYALAGFWYCACHDYKRGINLSLRADRFASLARVAGPAPPPHIPMADWLDIVERDDGVGLPLRIAVTGRGMRRADLPVLFGRLRAEGAGSGVIEGTIPRAEIAWYATRLLVMATDVLVEAPPELITALHHQAQAIAARYAG